mgnify:CR=1 FL=1
MWYCLLILPLIYLGYKKNLKFKIMILTLKLLLKMMVISLLEYLDPRLIKVNKNKYIVSYVLNNKLYKLHCKIRRGPTPVLQVIDQDLNDVTLLFYPWFGSNNDFHKQMYTPKDLNYRELTFQMANGDNKVFEEMDIIQV